MFSRKWKGLRPSKLNETILKFGMSDSVYKWWSDGETIMVMAHTKNIP